MPGRSSAELIEALGRRGVRLWSEAGRLRYAGPRGAVTPALRRELRERKPEILAALSAMRPPPPAPARIAREGVLQLSHGQQRLWFLHQVDPDDTSYNLWMAWRLSGRLDGPALERALNGLLERHEVLRTRFAAGPRQEIVEGWRIALPAEPATEESARQELRAETRRPFRLDRAPPVRARLLQLGDEEHVLLLVLHHVVADGWSLGVLDAELWAAYRGEAPAAPAVQYADYVAAQRRRLDEGGEAERQLAYWREHLAGAPTRLELPTDRPRTGVRRSAGGHRRFKLSADLTARLRELSRQRGVTLYMTLLAVFQVLLWRCGGQPELLVGTPVSGRGERGLERAVGFFVDTVVVRGDLRGNPPFAELLGRVRSEVLGALAHQDLPFERLVDALGGERDPGTTPLFQAVFAMQGAAPGREPVEGLDVRWYTVESETEQFELSLHVTETAERLLGDLSYRADLYEAATAKRLLRRYRRLLDEVAREPWRRLEELGLPDAAERRRVLEAGDGGRAAGTCRTVEAEIVTRARERPDAPAVRDGTAALTFAELEERSARVAGALRALGVGPEARVGLLSERRAGLVVGLLGVLRSGAAYVPLDPGLPAARLEQMLRDADVEVVVVGQPGLRGLAGGRTGLDLSSLPAGPAWRDRERAPDSLAYVLYTSGSTGRPKGVAVTRHALARYVRWAARRYAPGHAGGSVVHTSAGFDLTLTSLLVPLARGEPVELVPEDRGLEGLGRALAAGPPRAIL
ncbi:MAG TPA: condensation domain-containing protein, partial [Candidatus Dormibacteraeota bacterium]|nr:condensation domain-containing protein [Candidatus Dormibacteraeota bacterium]